MLQNNCQPSFGPTYNPCIIYIGPSFPQVDLMNGKCYPLQEIITKLLLYITLYAGGIVTTTTSTTTSSTSSTSTTSSSTTTTTTTLSFDTILTFTDSTIMFAEGVTGQSTATNPVLKFEFNKVLNPIGLYNVMIISVGGNPILQVTYRTEYTSHIFRFTHTNGTTYIAGFGNNINF